MMQLSHAHILICRTDNIGDLVLTLPLAAFLKQRHPKCRISFICRAYAEAVVRQCEFVDAVITLESLHDPVAQLQAGQYDCVIFAFPDRKLARAAKQAKIAHRVGTSHRLYHWWYCNHLAHFSRVRSTLHEAQLNFALLKPLGLDQIPPLQHIPALYGLGAGTQVQVDDLPALEAGRFHLILHPKSNGNGREWPPGHYTELARQLQAQPRVQIWLSGSAAEAQLLQQQAPQLLAQQNVKCIAGQLTLAQFIRFIQACDGLIASGTGPLHLAAALGRRTLGLFPPRKPIDPARWGALGTQAQNLCLPQTCQACPDAATCACMAALDVAKVQAVVTAWLQD
jgi:ADP-heptose:LPS heptosyltransferase